MDPTAHAIDLTAILLAVIAGLFGLGKIVITALIERRIKNAEMRDLLEKALDNGLGAIQQAASGQVVAAHVTLPAGMVPDRVAPGVQYVFDHAGEALDHFGITAEAVGEKLIARIGKKEIETNIAVTASPASPAIIPPLAPSPEGTTAAALNRDQLDRIARGAPV